MAISDDNMDIYVGNLPFSTTEDELVQLFSTYGSVERAKVMLDRETGRPRGFAFVTMNDDAEGNAAISALADQDFQGRALRVNAAEPRENRKPGGFGGGERRGGGGGGGYGDRRGGGGGGYGDKRGGGGYGDKRGGGGGGRGFDRGDRGYDRGGYGR